LYLAITFFWLTAAQIVRHARYAIHAYHSF